MMCLPKFEKRTEEKSTTQDLVASWLNQTGADAAADGGAQERSAREAAERAIREFQKTIFDLTFDQAKEMYIRLLAGRGFNLARDQAEEPRVSSASKHGASLPKNKEAV